MTVASLFTKDFRNLKEKSISFSENINLVVGDNGSGKSSLLEAIFFLGHGKSFRSTKSEALINFDNANFVLSAKDANNNQLGVSKSKLDSGFLIKVNGEKKQRVSELAKALAVQIITPESFKLFFGGAKERRKFLDLGLFHVEHSFQRQWKVFSRILKQRNACLKNRIIGEELEYWTEQFYIESQKLSSLRSDYVVLLKEELQFWLTTLLPEHNGVINVQYYQGWNSKKDLLDVLKQNREKEIQLGYSSAGAHKFDFRFLIDKQTLDLKLSRGQQKLFLLALTLAQSELMKKVTPVKPILLIDDVGAELDSTSRKLLAEAISKLECQVILTAIEEQALESMKKIDNNYKMFHVKHGEISELGK